MAFEAEAFKPGKLVTEEMLQIGKDTLVIFQLTNILNNFTGDDMTKHNHGYFKILNKKMSESILKNGFSCLTDLLNSQRFIP